MLRKDLPIRTDLTNAATVTGSNLSVTQSFLSPIRSGLSSELTVTVPPPLIPQLWTPSQITTRAWFDAFLSNTIVLDGSNKVIQWLDISGSSNIITQSIPSNRPLYQSGQYLDFSPSLFSRLEFPSGFANEWSQFSLFFVMASDTINQSNNAFFAPAFDFGKGLEISWLNTISQPTMLRINSSSFLPRFTSGLFSNDNNFHVTSVIANSTSLVGRYDGSNVTAADSSGISPLNFNGIYCLGTYALNLGSTFYGDFKIKEFIMANSTLSQENIERVEGYLSHKWGLSGNLPSGHPYKNNPPYIF